jgi:pyridoxine 4-dehydrogenase
MRRHLTRFQPEVSLSRARVLTAFAQCLPQNFDHNFAIVRATSALAEKKSVTPAQLAIAWVTHLGPHVVALPGSSKASRTLENLGAAKVSLTDAEISELNKIVDECEVKGGRYNDAAEPHMHLWG